jgi:hypothetical protein
MREPPADPKMVDPLREGLWLVITASGTRHLIDARDPDRSATVTRATGQGDPQGAFVQASLRRDGETLNLVSARIRRGALLRGRGPVFVSVRA